MAGRSPFTTEFKAAHAALAGGGYADHWSKLVEKLARLSEDAGPHDAHSDSLEDLRKQAKKDDKSKKMAENEAVLAACGGYDTAKPTDASKLTGDSRKRAAALKLLRHMYLLRRRGGHRVWVVGLANSFTDWPSVAMGAADLPKLKTYLGDTDEPFSAGDKKHLAQASQEALKMVQKTLVVLADGGTAKKPAPALALVKRWFADSSASDTDVTDAVSKLTAGFKKIQAVLNAGHLVLTDHPEVRNATTGDNAGFWQSEAFVKGAREGMDVIYVEPAFFAKGKNTLSGLKNWARILVHELSHRELATKDKFYSWQGMKPDSSNFPLADALDNADSWAFFCVDAAGQLTKSERNVALAT